MMLVPLRRLASRDMPRMSLLHPALDGACGMRNGLGAPFPRLQHHQRKVIDLTVLGNIASLGRCLAVGWIAALSELSVG